MAQHLLFSVWVGASQLSDVPWFNRMKSDSPSLVFCLEFHLWLSPVLRYRKSVGFMVFLRNKAFYFPWPKRHSVGMFKSSGHKMWLENEKCIRVISALIKQHWVPTEDGFLTAMHGWEQETKPPFPQIQQYDHTQKTLWKGIWVLLIVFKILPWHFAVYFSAVSVLRFWQVVSTRCPMMWLLPSSCGVTVKL